MITMAFLSGKGGSGKTTLALSMADLLSRCGIRTLLIDCDMSTNGATYFYEARLKEENEARDGGLVSFLQILTGQILTVDVYDAYQDGLTTIGAMNIKRNLDFIPSVPSITDQNVLLETLSPDDLKEQFDNLFLLAKRDYEVVLFDCQAGYTSLLPSLLPRMDVDLFVLEPDSVSASAMRNLHLKAGYYFGRAKLYQVFNKATPDEYEIYSKIVGTFFTNIGTLLFDWKIRQAFSRTQIPDMESTSRKYGYDLCEVCRIIFPERKLDAKIERYFLNLQVRETREKQEQMEAKKAELEKELTDLRKKKTWGRRSLFLEMVVAGILSVVAGIFSVLGAKDFNRLGFTDIIAIFSFGMSISIATIYYYSVLLFSDTRADKKRHIEKLTKEVQDSNQALKEAEIQLTSIQRQLNSISDADRRSEADTK